MNAYLQKSLEDCSYTCGLRRFDQPPIKTWSEFRAALFRNYVAPVIVFGGVGLAFLGLMLAVGIIFNKTH